MAKALAHANGLLSGFAREFEGVIQFFDDRLAPFARPAPDRPATGG
jgi:hypothetical protein